jgi:hypothetical protein
MLKTYIPVAGTGHSYVHLKDSLEIPLKINKGNHGTTLEKAVKQTKKKAIQYSIKKGSNFYAIPNTPP